MFSVGDICQLLSLLLSLPTLEKFVVTKKYVEEVTSITNIL